MCIPATVIEIQENAFRGWKSLKKLIFKKDSQLRTIGPNAFRDSGIICAMIPGTVKSIGAGAFSGCSQLHTIYINEGITEIGPDMSGLF